MRPSGPLAGARAEREADQRRGTRQLLIARALFMVFSYLTSVVLARELGPAGFGFYGILLSTLVWLEMLSFAGVPGALSKLIPEHPGRAKQVEQSARVVLLATSLSLFAIGWLLAPVVAELLQIPDGTRLFRLAILDIPLAAAYQGYSGTLIGRRRFGLLGLSQTILGAGKLLGVLALLLIGISVERALIANVAASCVALAFLLIRYPPSGFRPVQHFLRRILGVALPMAGFYAALQVLVRLDLWFLSGLWHGDDAVLGQYVAALKIAQTLIIIPMVQSTVLLSSVSGALAASDRIGAHRHVLDASRFALILTAAACAIVGGSASSLMGLVYSSRFAAGGPFLVVQLIAFSCFGFMDAFAHALMATGRSRVTAGVLASFIPVVGIANLLLIPRFGPVGAAASLLVGMLGVALVLGSLVWKAVGRPISPTTAVRVMAAAAVVTILGIIVPTSGPMVLLEMAVLGGAYLMILRLLGEISAKDFVLPRAENAAESTPQVAGAAGRAATTASSP